MSFLSFVKAFWSPDPIRQCQKPSYIIIIRFLPLWIQCSLLHPRFAHSSTLRWIRFCLAPLNCFISLKTPINHCFAPILNRGVLNMLLAIWSFHFASKSLEWGMTGGYLEGKYWTRPTSKSSSIPTAQAQMAAMKLSTWSEVAGWTTEQFFCLRGLQYGWGTKNSVEGPRLPAVIRRLFLVTWLSTSSTAFLLMVRNQGSPMKALEVMGIPRSGFSNLVAELLTTLAFGCFLISAAEIGTSQLNLLYYVIHGLGNHMRLPKWLLRSTDPILSQHAFDSPHTSTSLSYLWGKAWHQLFRREFLMCGGIPASSMARKLGAGLTTQKICGLFGSFFVSALMHEYVVHHFAPKPHPFPHVYFEEFPSSFAYFFIQPFGILIEPYIIPLIPRRIGGGWLWVVIFTLLTATPFRNQWIRDFRLIDNSFKPLKDWNLWTFLLPGQVYNI
ncbi:hypothetical protein DFH28DRAFT_966367 [Melampsora americana]|nr:hypothetical protein DFH28DRAFT_966367 [Melampsora americana]